MRSARGGRWRAGGRSGWFIASGWPQAKTRKGAKKGAIKNVEPKANPKGGFNFTSQAALGDGSVRTNPPLELNFAKINYHK